MQCLPQSTLRLTQRRKAHARRSHPTHDASHVTDPTLFRNASGVPPPPPALTHFHRAPLQRVSPDTTCAVRGSFDGRQKKGEIQLFSPAPPERLFAASAQDSPKLDGAGARCVRHTVRSAYTLTCAAPSDGACILERGAVLCLLPLDFRSLWSMLR